MNEEILRPYIRAVTEKDKWLPKFSYSKIEQFLNCPLGYNFKYNKGMYSKDTSIALELGSLCHYVLEQKGKAKINNEAINYKDLHKILNDGTIVTDQKTWEYLSGVEDLKKKYWEIWSEKDSEDHTYDDKLETFKDVLKSEMEDKEWHPVALEDYFEFVWNNKAIFHGFIDRIDENQDGKIKTIDYKTSKKIYDRSKLTTSLQFGIYACAILNKMDQLPDLNEYHFVFLDKKQQALTKGWEKRFIKKIEKTLYEIEMKEDTGIWEADPSPLCHWCNFCCTNPNANEFKHECEYYSLWTPNNKVFTVNKEWTNEVKPIRKLIF